MTDRAVIMACNAAYAPYALAAARSIAAAHPDRDFDICLFSADVLDIPAAAMPPGLRVARLDAPNPYATGGPASRHGAETYLRLVIPDLVAGRYRRILYLDSDILCTGPGIGRLLDAPMGGAWVAAVRDNQQWRAPGRRVAEFRTAGRPARPYFNAGVLLIDVPAWQAADIGGQALRLFAARGAMMVRHDQSLLNLIADGRWAELSPVWNWQYTRATRFFADLAEPRLIHFIGPAKPWRPQGAGLPARFRAPYADVAALWPGTPGPAVPPGVPAQPEGLAALFLRHALAVGATQRYLSRFPDPFTPVPAA